jgi:mannose-6-phosphate isomerase-like protein (cupin superfamily)
MKHRLTFLVLALLSASAGAAPEDRSPVTYLPAAQVEAAFSRGMPLLETSGYKVHASRREAAGQAEIHERDTDIIHVLEGTAELVTGGEMVEGRVTAPEERRGAGIRGGETRSLGPGDVVIVPHGVPHWFREVKAPFLYYVVKVPAPAGGTK